MTSELELIFVSGLTGVGKSTTLEALQASDLTLLPNRRELTDDIIIPWVQEHLGQEKKKVTDRLERFDLTRTYREHHKSGIVTALLEYLEDALVYKPPANQNLLLADGTNFPLSQRGIEGDFIFDNIRGSSECKAALETFPKSRYIFLDAPPLTRLKRILGRDDSFDQTNAARLENTTFVEQLMSLDVGEVFDIYELARLEANSDIRDDKILDATKIILKEQQNYNATEAADFLKSKLSAERLLYLDTSLASIGEVTTAIQEWL